MLYAGREVRIGKNCAEVWSTQERGYSFPKRADQPIRFEELGFARKLQRKIYCIWHMHANKHNFLVESGG